MVQHSPLQNRRFHGSSRSDESRVCVYDGGSTTRPPGWDDRLRAPPFSHGRKRSPFRRPSGPRRLTSPPDSHRERSGAGSPASAGASLPRGPSLSRARSGRHTRGERNFRLCPHGRSTARSPLPAARTAPERQAFVPPAREVGRWCGYRSRVRPEQRRHRTSAAQAPFRMVAAQWGPPRWEGGCRDALQRRGSGPAGMLLLRGLACRSGVAERPSASAHQLGRGPRVDEHPSLALPRALDVQEEPVGFVPSSR